MMRRSFVVLVVACASCGGGAKPPPAQAPSAAPQAATDAAPAKEENADSGAKKAESFVVVPRPSRSLARLRTLMRGSPSALGVVDKLASFGRNIDLEQPVYAVLAGLSSATSVGLTPEVAKTAREASTNECDVIDVQGVPRYVCPSGPDGEKLKPLAAAPPPSATTDAHVELTADGLAKLAGRGGGPTAILERFALGTEIRSVSADLALEGAAEVKLTFGLSGKGRWASGAISAPVAAPPSTFARLPADAEIAFFLHAPPAADQGVFRKEILDGIAATDANCTESEIAEARSHFEKLLFTGGSLSLAAGFDRTAAETAAEAFVKTAVDKRKNTALRAATAAWIVVGVEEPAAKWVDNVTWLTKTHCAKDKKPTKVTVLPKPSPRLGLPAGAVEIIERKQKDNTAPVSYTFIVPDKSGGPERTWIAVGEDEAIVAARVKASAVGAPDATLAKRSGLTALREPATFAGFFTATGFAWATGDAKDLASAARMATVVQQSRFLATGGRTPVVFRGEMTKDANSKSGDGQFALRVGLDGAAIGDLATVALPGL
jgi:hypothetical protein